MENEGKVYVGITLLVVIILGWIYFGATPTGRETWNRWFYDVQKEDDATKYETIKKVEDNCRAMIAIYESDVLTYEHIKIVTIKKTGLGRAAKMRAKNCFFYNNYVKESCLEDNIPEDIKEKLESYS